MNKDLNDVNNKINENIHDNLLNNQIENFTDENSNNFELMQQLNNLNDIPLPK